MATALDTARTAFSAMQTTFTLLSTLQLDANDWPQQAAVNDGDAFDFIVVGSGSSGGALAARLSEMDKYSVLLIEAGDNPRIESQVASLFPFQSQSPQDWNFKSENDGYAAQQHNNGQVFYTSGKLLGGTSDLHHYIYTRPGKSDYDNFAKQSNDTIWAWDNVLPYYQNKIENVHDPELLSTEDGKFLGKAGNIGLVRGLSDVAVKLLDSAREIGYETPLTPNKEVNVGISAPLLYIYDERRQGNARCYIKPDKNRSNFHVLRNTLVTKVTFDGKNANGVVALLDSTTPINLKARKEVIVSAGAINTPVILLQSGIGPKSQLDQFGIPVVADLPVGENLKSHVNVFVSHKMNKTAPTAPGPLTAFPLAGVAGLSALDKNQAYPDYETINLLIPTQNDALLTLCMQVYGFKDEICQRTLNTEREQLFTLHVLLQPESSGSVSLRGTDEKENLLNPVIKPGLYSNDRDLDRHAEYLQNHARLVNTTYFKSIDAEREDYGLEECKNLDQSTRDYWKCYARNMMCSVIDVGGTCSVGQVLDSNLRVYDVKGLRVVDASAIPTPLTSNYSAHCILMAEVLADLIKKEYAHCQ